MLEQICPIFVALIFYERAESLVYANSPEYNGAATQERATEQPAKFGEFGLIQCIRR